MKQYNPQDGQLMLRFEQLRFAPMPMSEWNGNFVTPVCVAHTLTPAPGLPMQKKQKTQATTASISLRDGTRLTMIFESTSPYMRRNVQFPAPQPPLVVVSYSETLSTAVCPFRVSLAGTIHNLQEAEPTNKGDLRRNFKLADEQGNWIHCVAFGRHAEDDSLENFRRIVVYFGNARPANGHAPQAVRLFKDAYIVPLKRRMLSLLEEQVMWQ